MKLRPYHTLLVFAILVMSAIFSSVSNYRKAQYAIIKDMDQALAQTLQERQDHWITPDTIQSYRSHLSIDLLKQTSILCYAMKEERKGNEEERNETEEEWKGTPLASRTMLLAKNHIQGYANCSMLDVWGMSNQRTSMTLTLMAMLWAIWSVYYLRRKNEGNTIETDLLLALEGHSNTVLTTPSTASLTTSTVTSPMLHPSERQSFGTLSYSSSDDTFYKKESDEAIKFTPMQHKLMQLFFKNEHHKLSKQEICDALWPKKPDASETLYTLIRRIKPIIENNSNLMIESERGKAYRLTEK